MRKCLLLAIFSVLVFASCQSGEDTPDVSGIKVDINARRFDKDLAKTDTNALSTGLHFLHAKYPDFLDLYLDRVMGFRIEGNYDSTNPGVSQGLRGFLTHKDIRGLFDTIAVHYPETKEVDAELAKGFQYMKHYYSDYKIPNIIYFISGLNNYGAIVIDNGIGIGLDMFLGNDYPFYRSVGIQEYLKVQVSREYIPVAAFRAVYQDMHPDTLDNRPLLDIMLQKGKEQYFLSKILPFVPEATRLGYTEDQLKGANKNEAFIYNYFVQKELLYVTALTRTYSFVNEGPGVKEISEDCPGNIGTWVGLQIVKAYMEEHPKTTLEELFKPPDPQAFLRESKYKPK